MSRILVIDNIQSNLKLIVTHLRDSGCEVITSSDGASGIKKAKLFKPDLIVLDLAMEKMSGFDVCKILKSDSDTKNIMIVAVTAVHSKEARVRAFEVGADEYMEKTFDKETLLAKVKALLRIKSLNDELRKNYGVLEEQSRQFEMQLEMAKHIQQALIAEMSFTFNDISFASCYRPAYDVGGDFYDVVTFGSNKLAVFIADVSGHGVSAALLTAMMKIMFRNALETNKEPDKLLHQMNEEFCGIFQGASVTIYACAFFALIDLKERELRYSNAGGTLPLFLNFADKTVTEPVISGKPLGIMNDSEYVTQKTSIGKGDILFFQTDGLCDAMHKDEPEVFVEKLSALLLDSIDNNPEEIIEYAMSEFCTSVDKPENDDVSIIVCKME